MSAQAKSLVDLHERLPSWPTPARAGGPPRIALTSGKGGVGKSQIAANLALALARSGRRVLLVDADLGLASLDLVLGVRAERHLVEVVRGEARAADIAITCPGGVDLLPAAPGRYDMANLGPLERARLRAALDEAAHGHAAVLLDVGAGLGASAVELAGRADETIVVVTPDPVSIRDAYATIKTLAMRGSLRRAWLLPNQVRSVGEAERVVRAVRDLGRRFLGIEVRATDGVPHDPEVSRSVALGAPLLFRAPRSPAARAIERLAALLEREVQTA